MFKQNSIWLNALLKNLGALIRCQGHYGNRKMYIKYNMLAIRIEWFFHCDVFIAFSERPFLVFSRVNIFRKIITNRLSSLADRKFGSYPVNRKIPHYYCMSSQEYNKTYGVGISCRYDKFRTIWRKTSWE